MNEPVDLLMGEGHRQTAVTAVSGRREGVLGKGCPSEFQPDEHLQAGGTPCTKPWGRGEESEYVSGFLKNLFCPH